MCPRKMFKAVHRLQVVVEFVVGINEELRNGKFAEDVAQTAAQGNNSFGSGSKDVDFRNGKNRGIVEHIVTLASQR